jgi:DNA-directed RNA polymerase subunit N (RpoN/RPB10)
VILITSIRNDQQWFSAFNKKDIFIHGAEWDLVSNIDSKFELAYQCVENIFQSLMDLKVDKYHDPSIGCINDLCLHKPDILLKLQTGNICPACIQKSNEMGIENSIIKQIHTIINRIRVEFVLTLDYFNNVQLDPVEVDEKGKIKIGDKPIKLDFLPRVMYITFLMNPDGILSSEKCEKYNLFLEVSELLKPTKDDHEKKSRELSIKKMCCRRFVLYNVRYNDPPTFETYRSKIKTALKKALGENNSKLYCISLTEDNVFTINLREELVRLPEELNNQ